MNIAFITISVNPNSPSGSLDYFSEMASQLPTLDKDNNYIFIINLLTKSLFNYRYKNLKIIPINVDNFSRLKRILYEQFVIPNILKKNNIDIFFTSSGGGIALSDIK